MDIEDLKGILGTAEADQTEAGQRRVAVLMCTYFFALVENGLERSEALAVVIAWQAEVVRMGRRDA